MLMLCCNFIVSLLSFLFYRCNNDSNDDEVTKEFKKIVTFEAIDATFAVRNMTHKKLNFCIENLFKVEKCCNKSERVTI